MNWRALALVWFAGANLRITLLAVPPLIPLIHEDLHLSEKAVGALNGLPVLTLAAGAVFGSLLLARLGVIRALIFGLLLVAVAGALRGVGANAVVLFAMTVAMGLGVAVMQPAMPTLVGHWFPSRLGLATAVYVNGLLVGEILSAALTIPLVLPLTGGSWAWSFAFWSLPAVLNAVLLALALRRGAVTRPGLRGKDAPRQLWWPDWRNGAMIRCGLILGCASSTYFAANAFIPDYLHAIGRGDLTGPALTALNGGQLPASFIMLAAARWLTGRAWPLIALGLLAAASVAGITLARDGFWLVAAAAATGFSAAFILILVLALPPLLAVQDDVHRFSAGVFLIGYALSFLTPVASGALWDAFHIPALAFLPIGFAGIFLAVLALNLHFSQAGQ